jgi:hypothetical protein
MAFSTDSDLTAIIPDILTFGISSFYNEHALAQAEIERELRIKWYPKLQRSAEMDATLLTAAQWTTASAYLVLWKHALPKLTNWVDGDRFQSMITFYKTRYNEELDAVIRDGVEYDLDEDNTVSETEKAPIYFGRLVR